MARLRRLPRLLLLPHHFLLRVLPHRLRLVAHRLPLHLLINLLRQQLRLFQQHQKHTEALRLLRLNFLPLYFLPPLLRVLRHLLSMYSFLIYRHSLRLRKYLRHRKNLRFRLGKPLSRNLMSHRLIRLCRLILSLLLVLQQLQRLHFQQNHLRRSLL